MINNNKMLYILSFVVLFAISCEEDAGVDCEAAKTTFTNAVNAAGEDGPSDEAECQVVVDAADEFLATGCDTSGTDVGMISAMDCGCVPLTNAFNEAADVFNAGFVSGTGTIEDCQAYVDAMVDLVDAGCITIDQLGLDQESYDEYSSGNFCEEYYGVTTITTPEDYTFDSRFNDGESSVSYSGQVVRNLLINDIKALIADNVGGGNTATITSMMANDDPTLTISTSTDIGNLQTFYHDISTSQLNDRLGAVTSYTDPGYEANAQDMIAGWVAESEYYSVRPGGIDLGQMAQKVMWGAIAYWQGTSKYMSKIPNDDNTVSDDGDPYTAMEHHWDESFGYFGAARDYNTGYTDDSDRKSDPYFDSNGDGSIDFKSEYNMGWSVTAAKRDVVDASTDYDFTGTIMNAYLEGRTLIYNQAPLDEILVQRDIILNNWEKVVAAVSIHYINDTMSDLAALIAAADTSLAWDNLPSEGDGYKYNIHWAEMRAYAHGLIYNDFKLISDADIATALGYMGNAPAYNDGADFSAMQTLFDNLAMAKDVLQAAYDFDADHMNNW